MYDIYRIKLVILKPLLDVDEGGKKAKDITSLSTVLKRRGQL